MRLAIKPKLIIPATFSRQHLTLNMGQALLYRRWRPLPTLILAGALSALYFALTGTVWAVTGEFTRLGAHFLHLFNIDTSDWAYLDLVPVKGWITQRSDGWLVLGMFAGALLMVLLNNGFKLRLPPQRRRLVQAFVGGTIAGFGARMAMGCNLAAFFTGVPQFSLHSWLFILASVTGSYMGTRIIRQRWWKGRPVARKKAYIRRAPHSTRLQPRLGLSLAVLILAGVVVFLTTGRAMLAYGLFFGVLFGILLERGQICFTSALRDFWLFGNGAMMKAIVIGMAVSSVLTFAVLGWYELEPITQITAPSTGVGGVLFGIGIVLASGCETGMMYRMMEGQLVYAIAFVGNVLGATLLAYGWDHWALGPWLTRGGHPINLAEQLNLGYALLMTLIFLGFLYLFFQVKGSPDKPKVTAHA